MTISKIRIEIYRKIRKDNKNLVVVPTKRLISLSLRDPISKSEEAKYNIS